MRLILKSKWALLVIWLVMAVALMMAAPPMSELVREKGQLSVPDGYASSKAAELLREMNAGGEQEQQIQSAMIFYKEQGLGQDDKERVQAAVESLKTQGEALGVTSVMNPFDEPQLEDKMVSEDGKAVMIAISSDAKVMEPGETRSLIHEALGDIGVDYYMTGSELVNEDTIQGSQDGLKKTEYITIIFILVILFAVFRSLVAPFVPLLTVGLSYLVSQSIVAFLVDSVNFPLSTFTQIFMVAVMFGIGTDYCILLISRFKEEMSRQEDISSAIVETYRTAGRTVFFSGLAVLIGFVSIGMSQFILYRSAVAVAVGIAVMLAALFTIVPFFMAVLGSKLFWPSKGSLEHKESRLWGMAGAFSLKRPLAALIVVAVICVPFLVTYSGQLSFNNMEEISEDYESVKGFNLIESAFGAGQSMPATVVIKNDDRLDTGEYLALTEAITRSILKVEGVEEVRSASRPAGDEIEDFRITAQAAALGEGIGQSTDGLSQIGSGLSEASRQLSQNEPQLAEAAVSSSKLTEGTAELNQGIGELSAALAQIQGGMTSGAAGAGELGTGLQQAKASAQQLANAHQELLAGYQAAGDGISVLGKSMGEVLGSLQGVEQMLAGLQPSFTALEAAEPQLQQNSDYMNIRETVTQTSAGLSQLSSGVRDMEKNTLQAAEGLKQANQGYAAAVSGQEALTSGLSQILQGIQALEDGLEQAAEGQGAVIQQLPDIQSGLTQIEEGQQQIENGFKELSGQLGELTGGLDESVKGISQIQDGLTTAQTYLAQIENAGDPETSGFLVPEEALSDPEMTRVYDTYMSPDRKLMTLDVVFAGNPYAAETLTRIGDIENAVATAVKGTKLEQAETAVSGVTSTYADLKQISDEDYNRTVTLMLGGIFLVLVLLLRSVVMPIYLMVALVVTYYVSMGVTEFVFVDLLGYTGISWATPFFGFVMLTALGVDYSIFLMDRFNENKELDVQSGILYAMKNMGTVILSAVLILGGTFAAMYPSGVLSMMQIATVVLTGLVLYALVFLPFFVPVMVKLFGRGNWWPFKAGSDKERDSSQMAA
ncbi:MMPL family transporter [Paenibacillus sp. F411]|uniref:MMPL family transporter n=1 Tax=Paenibacillus sp. F411 TaxID=2820239 RepID=UPI001AAFA3EE|nr:MMPL family transporter [Paenibacillus sp. F411]MBO2942729.1 MMPL family transporter [Paenibacillus sp. F411]